MNRMIHKQIVPVVREPFPLALPDGAELLDLQMQKGMPCL
jgi:hypothetical protein